MGIVTGSILVMKLKVNIEVEGEIDNESLLVSVILLTPTTNAIILINWYNSIS
jgi:hypothetical protein